MTTPISSMNWIGLSSQFGFAHFVFQFAVLFAVSDILCNGKFHTLLVGGLMSNWYDNNCQNVGLIINYLAN